MGRIFRSHEQLVAAEGTHLGHSSWLEMTQARINRFADATDDHQWIHVDPARAAAEGPYGTTIAHGYLTLSLVNRFLPELMTVEGTQMGINYGCDRVRFPAPVRCGDHIRAAGELYSVVERKGASQVVVRVTVERQGSDRPCAIVDTISRFYW